MESTTDIRRIHTINNYLKEDFGEKIIKLSLDGGFTCPNRDGTKSTSGCSFCSSQGSGELASKVETLASIDESIKRQINLLSTKWPKVTKYIAYFQNYTNTYAPVDELREKFETAISHPSIVGLAIATRPDCIDDDTLDLLSELNEKTYLWVELGLQTYHDSTAKEINRCYETSEYEDIVSKLLSRNIKVVCHVILGLPGETKDDMIKTVKEISKDYLVHDLNHGGLQKNRLVPDLNHGGTQENHLVSDLNHTDISDTKNNPKKIFGIKFHLLNLVKGSPMAKTNPNYASFESIDSYTDTVIELLRYVPWEITIHRLTADVPRKLLLTPTWSYEKLTILNTITKKMREQNIIQGDFIKYR